MFALFSGNEFNAILEDFRIAQKLLN